MKANRKFVESDEAVSPVIAVILMVAITVVLAATVFVLVSDIGNQGATAPPNTSLSVTADNANDDIIIRHVSGELLRDGDFQVSVTLGAGSNPVYETCTDPGAMTTNDFQVGEQLQATTETQPAAAACDTAAGTIAGGTALVAGTYHVVIVHIPSSSTMINQDIIIS